METSLGDALWRQFGAVIDALDAALVACPDGLWTGRIWPNPPPPWFPRHFAEFWHIAYHTLVWTDLYLAGVPEEAFVTPAPFAQGEIDSVAAQPEQPYAREELRVYLASTRQKCHTLLTALTDEQARRPVEYAWTGGEPISYLELQFRNMRHVQEHAAQLLLFLGQHGIPDTALAAAPRAG